MGKPFDVAQGSNADAKRVEHQQQRVERSRNPATFNAPIFIKRELSGAETRQRSHPQALLQQPRGGSSIQYNQGIGLDNHSGN